MGKSKLESYAKIATSEASLALRIKIIYNLAQS